MDFGQPTKLYYAKQLAAALGFIGLCRSDRVKIEALNHVGKHPGPVLRGRQSLWPMLEHLESIQVAETVHLTDSIKSFALRNSGKGILVLISDLMDKRGYEPGFRFLLAQQMDVYVIQLLSPEELNPDVKGDLKLIDCEDGDEAEITASNLLLDRYQRTLAAFVESARDFCTRRGRTYLMTNTTIPVEQLVASYLGQRGLIR